MRAHWPARALCAALFAVVANATQATDTRCDVGTAPGLWDLQQPPGSRWGLLTGPHCQLANLLQTAAKTPPRVLLLSDSTDRHLVEETCEAVEGSRLELHLRTASSRTRWRSCCGTA